MKPPVHLNISPSGGTLNGPGITDTVFDPAAAGTGSHDYTFEYTDSNGCFADTQFSVEINPIPIVFIGGLSPQYCLADSVTAGLGGNPQGGTFSGQAVAGDSVQTWLFGSGTYGVSYTYTDSMGCTSTDSATYEVVEEPSTAYAGQDTASSSTTVQLDADTPAAGSGSWSIASGSGGSFANTSDPQTNFSGQAGNTYELVWTVSNPPCASTTDTVTVEFTGSPLPFMVCNNETIYVHPTDNHASIQYGCGGITAGADDDFNGEQNTADVVSSCPPPTAANVCDTLTAFGHNDWYLPAYEELDCLRNNAASIGGFSTNEGYWASTEGSGIFSANARYRTFPSGVSGFSSKSSTHRVRCVRKD